MTPLGADPSGERPSVSARVTEAVREAIHAVYRDTGRATREIEADDLLGSDLGLDSLDLAQVVVLLERSLGVDPFRRPQPGVATTPIRTVGNLSAIYSSALAPAPAAGD